MNLLIVNDDGINAVGIKYLAEKAAKYGKVYVLAPDSQCSAMSQRISIRTEMTLKKVTGVYSEGIEAYSLSGTPADCVKVALKHQFKNVKFDYCLSGINAGYNMGVDINYSGTVGAANEAILNGVPGIALSTDFNGHFEVIDNYIDETLKRIFSVEPSTDYLWNVNFPEPAGNGYNGIKYDRVVAKGGIIGEQYEVIKESEEGTIVKGYGVFHKREEFADDTDVAAVLDGYVSVGKIYLR